MYAALRMERKCYINADKFINLLLYFFIVIKVTVFDIENRIFKAWKQLRRVQGDVVFKVKMG